MPLYEYKCNTCGRRFEALIYGSMKPVCPKCNGQDLDRLFSAFAVSSGSGSSKSDGCAYQTPSGGCSSGGG